MKTMLILVLVIQGKTVINQTYYDTKQQCLSAAKNAVSTDDRMIKRKACINFIGD